MKKVAVAVFVFFLALPAICAEIEGKWVGEVDGTDGKPLELTYTFLVRGDNLLGVIESRLGRGAISEGKVNGKNIEFKLNTGEFIIINNGTLSGDEIHMTQTTGEEKIKYILKRGIQCRFGVCQ